MKWLATAVILVGALDAQAPPLKDRITMDVNRVAVLCTVTDKKGHFITDLKKTDFEVLDNNVLQPIVEFAGDTDRPLRLAILVDASASVREQFHLIQEAAIAFLQSAIRPGQDKAMVVSFDTSVDFVADLTDDLEKMARAIRELRAGRGTALYDAIDQACRRLLPQEESRHGYRRAIVMLSDGDDTQSDRTRGQALEMAQKSDTILYALSFTAVATETPGDRVLKFLAAETGGRAFFPRTSDLGQAFAKIANELRHQYSILYRPEPLRSDGLYHPIEVRVKGHKGIAVQARRGYYAPRLAEPK